MPQRETVLTPKSLLTFGSVNERAYDTEIRDNEWHDQVGSWPESTGLLARLWGKRTHAKFSGPIMGIWQFFTPYGYAVGLYQFSGSLELGRWTVPTSRFDLTPPSDAGFNTGGYTLNEWGWSPTGQFNLRLEPSNGSGAGLPNDTNGSPVGNGSRCHWTEAPTDYALLGFITSQTQCSNTLNVTVYQHGVNPPGRETAQCPLFPYPAPMPIGGYPGLGPVTAASITGSPTFSKLRQGFAVINPGLVCDFDATVSQHSTIGGILETHLDLLTLQPLYQDQVITVVLVGTFSDDGNITEYPIELPLSVDFDPVLGNFQDVVFNLNDLLPEGGVVLTGQAGQQQQSRVTINTLRVYQRARICV